MPVASAIAERNFREGERRLCVGTVTICLFLLNLFLFACAQLWLQPQDGGHCGALPN
jgi:hypothetical protein